MSGHSLCTLFHLVAILLVGKTDSHIFDELMEVIVTRVDLFFCVQTEGDVFQGKHFLRPGTRV